MTAVLANFLNDTEQNTRLALGPGVPVIEYLKDVDALFASLHDVPSSAPHVLYPGFADRSWSAFRAAIRVLFGGQIPEAYPLLRLALENTLYAFHTSTGATSLAWARRGLTEADTRKVRQDFQIGKILASLGAREPDLAHMARRFYELTITWGAHPNVDGHAATSRWDDAGVHIDMLSPGTRFWKVSVQRVVRAGVLCLLILRSVPNSRFSGETQAKLNNLEAVTASWKEFRDGPAKLAALDRRERVETGRVGRKRVR